MVKIKPSTILFSLSLAGLYIGAWVLQTHIVFSSDVSVLIHGLAKILQGGSYSENFFETSPPMILYLYTPALLIKNIFAFSTMVSLKCYVFLLSSLSLAYCYYFIKKIFLPQDLLIGRLTLLLFAGTYLLLPLFEFGQKEPLFFSLIMPYIFAALYRLRAGRISMSMAVSIGLLAGLGVGIKPHFLLTPFLVEIYICYRQKSWRSIFRPEIVSLFGLLSGYVGLVVVLHHDYLQIVVPYILRNYYIGIATPWKLIYFHPAILVSFFVMTLCFISNTNDKYKDLFNVFGLVLFSFIMETVSQRAVYIYRALPCISLSSIMLVLWFILSPRLEQMTPIRSAAVFVLTILMFFALFYKKLIWIVLVLNPGTYFCFFSIIIFSIYLLNNRSKSLLRLFTETLIVISGSAWTSYVLGHTDWFIHQFLLTSLVLYTLYFVFLSGNYVRKFHYLLLCFVASMIIATQLSNIMRIYIYSRNETNAAQPYIAFFRDTVKNKSVYLLSTRLKYLFPAVDYSQSYSVSRFPYLWMLPGLVKGSHNLQDKKFLANMIEQDFERYQPDYIFIDINKYKNNLGLRAFNHLTFLKQYSDRFAKIWQNYKYVTTIEYREKNSYIILYKLAVYQRFKTTSIVHAPVRNAHLRPV